MMSENEMSESERSENEMSDNEINDPRPEQNTRGVTTGMKLKKEDAAKLSIKFNDLGQPVGYYQSQFITDMGLLVRNIKITYNDWRKVPRGEKETIWKEAKNTWNIKDDTNKKDVLNILSKAFIEFRCTLTRTYITKTMKYKEGKVVAIHMLIRICRKKKEEKWYKEELEQELRQKNLDNDDADPILVKEAISSIVKRIDDRSYSWIKAHTPSSNAPRPQTQNVIEEYKYSKAKEEKGEFVPTRIEDALVKALGKTKHNRRTRGEGGFVVLHKYFGKPPSQSTTRKTYYDDEIQFLIKKVQREAKEALKKETVDEVNVMMDKKWAEMVEKTSHVEANIGGSFKDPSPHRRDRSSCHSTLQIDPFVELKESVRCRLNVYVNEELIPVAQGMVLPWAEVKMVHNKPLTKENAHISIDKVVRGDVPLPVSWNGFTMVSDAEGIDCIILSSGDWSLVVNSKTRKLKRKDKSKDTRESANKVRKQSFEKATVKSNMASCDEEQDDLDQEVKSPEKGMLKGNKSSCDDEQGDIRPLSVEEVGELRYFCRSLEEKLCSLSKNATIEMVIDESVYNYKEGSARIFLTIVEIRQMFRNQWLNVGMLQNWGSFLYQGVTQCKATEIVAYMCPVKLSQYMYKARECEDYIAHVWKIQDEKKYIIGAFHEGNHWMLIVTCLGLNTIYILDSDQKTSKIFDIRERLNKAWFLHCAEGGRLDFARKNNNLFIKIIVCPQQPKNYKCGYYVMKWMYDITFCYSRSNEEDFEKLMAESTMSTGDMYEIKEQWATKCLVNL